MKIPFKRSCKKTIQVLLVTATLVVVFLQAFYLPVNAENTIIDISSYWGKETTHNISNEGTIDLTAFPSTEAGKLTFNITGSTARVTILGGGRTYTNLCIMIGEGAYVTLNNVSIDNTNFENTSPVIVNDNNADNRLMFSGENTLTGGAARPGITVLNSGGIINNITIDKSNPGLPDKSCILNVNGGTGAAGIGGMQNRDCGSITIKGGTINATSNENSVCSGAGIGGGAKGNGGKVTISGGIVTARGAKGGAGIGGGANPDNWTTNGGAGGEITITGGVVRAYGSGVEIGKYGGGTISGGGAGIGGGAGYNYGGVGGKVIISGGTVTAIGAGGGAGIGGGRIASGGDVNISGGIVYAESSDGGAGIGGGGSGSGFLNKTGGNGGLVTITGGTVEAVAYGSGCDIGNGNYGEGAKIYFSGGSIRSDVFNCAPVVSITDTRSVDRNVVTIPNISSATAVSYTVDGGETKYASTDSLGRLYLWLPGENDEKVYDLSVTILADPSKTYSLKTDPIVYKWGKPEIYTITDNRTIDLANFFSKPDASNLTIAASGSTAEVKIVGDANITYKNLRITIDKGAHVTLYNVNIDNSTCSVEYSPVEAGDSNTGNTLYIMQMNKLTGSKNMPGVFVAEGTNLNIFRSSDPMTGTARLYANGGADAAGIGGKNGGGAGSISFNNGSVTAVGNGGGSGIGGGNNGIGGTVSVVNAIITAQKGSNATYDIGGGQGVAGGKTYIGSGVIFASNISNVPEVSTSDSTQLGKKSLKLGDTSTNTNSMIINNQYNCGNIKTDSYGYLNLYFTKGTHSVFCYDVSKLFITSDSSSDYLTVTRLEGFSNTGYSADSSGDINISESGSYLISGNTTTFKSSIKVAPDINVDITLDNVKLSSNTSGLSLDSNTTVNLTIKGMNTLSGGASFPGITVPETSTLNIEGTDTDSLTVDGNGSAGIYNGGIVNIEGGKITANGGASGAGIGGSKNDAGGNITISGGIVTVTGGNGAAGIGGGENGAGGTATITGGMIKAVKGTDAPYDIGSGKGTGLASGTNTFIGGSINVVSVSSVPTDGTEPVYLTTVDVIDNNGLSLLDTTVSFTMPNGVKFDTATDSEGKLYPWLPMGDNITVTITSGGKNYTATGDVTIAGPNKMTTAPTVTSVTVTPATATVQKGETQTFNATITGINNPAQTVTWDIQGNTSINTGIDNTGKLTVATGETASTLTVTAISTADNTKSGTSTVTVTASDTSPTVTNVKITPATISVQKGSSYTFAAVVEGTNDPSQSVKWEITGKNSADTTINNTTGVLSVASDENSDTLTVTATSDADTSISGTATVTVTNVPATVTSVTIAPKPVSATTDSAISFSATIVGINNPSQAVEWSVSGNNSSGTTISNMGVLTIAADETATALAVTAVSDIDNSKFDTVTVDITTISPPAATVSDVTITPDNVTITKGTTFSFSASVTGTNSPSQTVTWAVYGNSSSSTIINDSGALAVAADETAATLTVTATSAADNAVSDTATVTVAAVLSPTVDSVTVSPSTATIIKGNTQSFTATVTGSNDPAQTVEWSVSENNSSSTTISSSGLLTVGSDETAAVLTVKALSTVDSTCFDKATVVVTTTPTPVATVSTVTITPTSATVSKGSTYTFGAVVAGTNNPSQSVSWSVSGNNNAGTIINSSGVLTVEANETATTLTVTATSVADDSKSSAVTVTVSDTASTDPTVDAVAVNPLTANVVKGGTEAFSAVVSGSNSPAQTVTWSVYDNTSSGTTINSSGLLTVGSDETAATLTIKAESTVDTSKSSTATVTVTDASTPAPTVTVVTVIASSSSVLPGATLNFTATVAGTNSPSQEVTWAVSGNNTANTKITSAGVLTVSSDETATSLTITATSILDNIKSGTATVTVTPLVTVSSVTVSPSSGSVQTGGTKTFTATVTGTNNPSQEVTWSVSGNNGVGTTISSSGVLTIASSETASTLTVKAASILDSSKYGTAAVTVTQANTTTPTTGGTGGGGSSASPSTDKTPTVRVKKKPDQPVSAGISVTATVDKTGLATVTVPENSITSAITKAKAEAKTQDKTENGIGIAVNVKLPGTAKSTCIVLTQSTLKTLIDAEVKLLEINGAPAYLSFNLEALKEIQKQSSGDVTLSLTPVTCLTGNAKTLIGSRAVYNISISYRKDGKTVSITSLHSGSVTISIPYTPGKKETVGYLFGVYVDGNGKTTRIQNSTYDVNSKSIIFDSNHFSIYGVGYTAPSEKFTDVSAHWAKEFIDYVVGRGLLSGTSTTTFSPNTSMSRGMLVTVLGKMAGVNVSSYQTFSFTDVDAEEYYAPYIEWACKNGVISGVGNSKFAPDRAVTREEIALILSNYAKATGYTLPVTREAVVYADANSISSTFKEAVQAMQQAGIMMGGNDNKFNPNANATRAEVSAMLTRYVKLTINPDTSQGWALNDAGQRMYYQDGKALTGWQDIGSGDKKKHYFFTSDGIMISGKWLKIADKWYYFYKDGSLAVSTKVDGYEVDANGVRKNK
ncbi:Ig-like protein group 2 [Kineothrix alysoides]|uniref:Ig-like protein group 2 n=1 Tax=Kineothrix alysoides TaxID=1469948 RepID=A0A4R1R3B7_9FIRM|nr:S-layer homology domain-containing protein [Kineothrix alysoides]TCL59868.1 Ig-like protein group 2 [Kineothrix alysoides]